MSNEGNDPIGEILTAIAAIQEALTPPSGATKIQHVYEEMVVEPGVFPAFINVPRRGSATIVAGTEMGRETIDMILLFGRAEEKYSSRAQRLWVPVVRAAFQQALKLNDGSVQYANVGEWTYDPIEINEVPYIGVTFTIECFTSGPVTVGT